MKIKRYELKTDRGNKITWANSASEARAKAIAKGFKVYAVKVKEIEV